MTNIEFLQRSLGDKKQGDYINIKGSHNQILNANIFDKAKYESFYKSDEWVDGGVMLDPSNVKDDDIVVTYYGDSSVEYSFIVGQSNQDSQQIALNNFVEKWSDKNEIA